MRGGGTVLSQDLLGAFLGGLGSSWEPLGCFFAQRELNVSDCAMLRAMLKTFGRSWDDSPDKPDNIDYPDEPDKPDNHDNHDNLDNPDRLGA